MAARQLTESVFLDPSAASLLRSRHCFAISNALAAPPSPTQASPCIKPTIRQTPPHHDLVKYQIPPCRHKEFTTNTLILREPPYLCVEVPTTPSLPLMLERVLSRVHTSKSDNTTSHSWDDCTLRTTVPSPFHSPSPIPILLQTTPGPMVYSHPPKDNSIRQINKSDSVKTSSQHLSSSSQVATPAQLSFVFLKLKEELPAFFDGHHSFDMYTSDMTFENSLSKFAWTQRGCPSYQAFLSSSRLMTNLCYSGIHLDLLRITVVVDSSKIEARWRVRGRPRVAWSRQERVILDGFSTFLVNSDGLICLHRMDKVMPSPKEKGRVLTWMAQLGVLLGLTPRPSIEESPSWVV